MNCGLFDWCTESEHDDSPGVDGWHTRSVEFFGGSVYVALSYDEFREEGEPAYVYESFHGEGTPNANETRGDAAEAARLALELARMAEQVEHLNALAHAGALPWRSRTRA